MTDSLEILEVAGGFMVRSKSVPGAWRLVTAHGCTCPAGERRTCRHRVLVDQHQRAHSLKNARPSAPVNVSALVD